MTDTEKFAVKVLGTLAGLIGTVGIVGYIKNKGGGDAAFLRSIPDAVERMAFVQKAKQQLGKPYIWAAAGAESFDCSGLTQWLYAQIGYSIPRRVTEQAEQAHHIKAYADYKKPAEIISDLQIGDCLGLDYTLGGRYDHVIIYIGNGQFIHASGGQSCPAGGSRCEVVQDPTSHFQGHNVRSVYSYFGRSTPTAGKA